MLFQTLKIEKKGRLEYYACGNIRQSKQGRSSLCAKTQLRTHRKSSQEKKPIFFFKWKLSSDSLRGPS